MLDRVAPRAQRARADAFLTRWGALAVLASRSVPIAAETLALLAGASPVSWRRFLPAAALGSLPPALFYAAAGAAVIDGAQGALVIGASWRSPCSCGSAAGASSLAELAAHQER